MPFTSERTIDRKPFEVLVDRNTDTQEVRISVYQGDTLLAIDFILPIDYHIERLVGLAKKRAPTFPNGDRA